MRFEVPQFIEIEDKIIGPLTWRQFVYLAGGAGIITVLYLSLPFILTLLLGLPVGLLSASLAFHKVNNRPFSIFLESCISYLKNTKLYLWKKEEAQSVIEREEISLSQPSQDLGQITKGSITSLSRKLELHMNE